MKTFTIKIAETLTREIQVEASDASEAFAIVREQYRREDIILDGDDFAGVEFDNVGDYSDVVVYVPDFEQYFKIAEGTGDNLLEEDIEMGYVDYIYYTVYDSEGEIDGGMMLLEDYFRNIFASTRDAVEYVLDDYQTIDGKVFYHFIHEDEWEELGLED